MKKKLRSILLIDDNEADNWFHKLIIKEMDIAEKIDVALDGVEALDYLKRENHLPPDLILLDINMPRINGWEFLEQYEQLAAELKAKIVIVMLTTSENPRDLEKAKLIKAVAGYKTKPLSEEMLTEIIEQYFNLKSEI